jgi:hypothetical protein
MSKDPEQFEKEREQRKEVRRRKRKKERKQLETLNNISQGKWRKIGAIAAWVGYRVSVGGEEEIVPVRRGASRMELSTINQNLKRYIRRKHQLQAERKKKQNQKRRQARKI